MLHRVGRGREHHNGIPAAPAVPQSERGKSENHHDPSGENSDHLCRHADPPSQRRDDWYPQYEPLNLKDELDELDHLDQNGRSPLIEIRSITRRFGK
jgi:hypothetical protein